MGTEREKLAWRSFAGHVGKTEKLAASMSAPRYEDDEETWWERNRSWAVPTAVGSAAFLLGAGAERHGRPDRGYLSNAGHYVWDIVRKLLGDTDDPMWKAVTEARKPSQGGNPWRDMVMPVRSGT